MDQTEFAKNLKLIDVKKERRQHAGQKCNPSEVTALRSAAGNNSYLGKETRPDIMGPTAILQQVFPEPVVADLIEANRITRIAKDFADTKVVVKPIPPEQVAFLTVPDASLRNLQAESSQAGWIFMAVDKKVL